MIDDIFVTLSIITGAGGHVGGSELELIGSFPDDVSVAGSGGESHSTSKIVPVEILGGGSAGGGSGGRGSFGGETTHQVRIITVVCPVSISSGDTGRSDFGGDEGGIVVSHETGTAGVARATGVEGALVPVCLAHFT